MIPTMLQFIRSLVHYPLQRLLQREFKQQRFTGFNERPIEYAFVFRHLAALFPKRVLDVGTGTSSLPHLMKNCGCEVTASDNVRDYWPSGCFNRHYHVVDDDITRTALQGPFDLVTCVSVLEHIDAFDLAMKRMAGLLAPGGHLILTCPFSAGSHVPNVYELPGSDAFQCRPPFRCQSFSEAELQAWTKDLPLRLVDREHWRCFDGEVWSVGNPVHPPVRVAPGEKSQIGCFLFRKCP